MVWWDSSRGHLLPALPYGAIMRTDLTIDGRKVICPHASLIGYCTMTARVGSYLAYRESPKGDLLLARMLGRIKFASVPQPVRDSKGVLRGYIQNHILGMVLVLGMEGTHAFERWIDPATVTAVYDKPPSALAAFFFAEKLPYDVHTMRRLIDHGTVSDHYINQHAERVAMFKARDAAAKVGKS